MLDWLLTPIDASRVHEMDFAISWHARLMVLAWGFLAPLAVFVARFFKVLPSQDWPNKLDNQIWWRSHWIGQSLVLCLTIIGFALVFEFRISELSIHQGLGYSVLFGLVFQVALGLFRGSKGGPTARATDGSLRGDHYDMTLWRRIFEALHKMVGYSVLFLAMFAILFGLWDANGPNWMWLALFSWWACLICLFVILQKRGMAVDTYQAIWGPDPAHPGNQRPAPKWGMHRAK